MEKDKSKEHLIRPVTRRDLIKLAIIGGSSMALGSGGGRHVFDEMLRLPSINAPAIEHSIKSLHAQLRQNHVKVMESERLPLLIDINPSARKTLELRGEVDKNFILSDGVYRPTQPLEKMLQRTSIVQKPTTLQFNDVSLGSSATLPVTLDNTGSGSITMESYELPSGPFTISGLSLPKTLTAGQKTSFKVTFEPTLVGGAQVEFQILANSQPNIVVEFEGYGVNLYSVDLSWNECTSQGIIGYDVFRGNKNGGPYPDKITLVLDAVNSYQDENVATGQTYYYVAVCVNDLNEESGYSNQAKAVIPQQ